MEVPWLKNIPLHIKSNYMFVLFIFLNIYLLSLFFSQQMSMNSVALYTAITCLQWLQLIVW